MYCNPRRPSEYIELLEARSDSSYSFPALLLLEWGSNELAICLGTSTCERAVVQ